jgi:hypothetical protein
MRSTPLIALLLAAGPLSATEYVFQNFDVFLRDRLGITWNTQLDVSIGAFDSGFTPTIQNYSTWGTHFTTDPTPGYYVGPAGGGPEYSAALHLSDNAVLPVGTQLRLWIRTPIGFAGGAQTALFTDASWLIVSNSPTDVTTRYYDFSNITSAEFGTFDFGNHLASTVAVTAVPEPSTYGIGLGVSVLAMAGFARRRRKALK